MLNPPLNGKIQGLFKAFESFSNTFQGEFNFQGLFKTVLYIQVLFKSVRTMSFLACDDFCRLLIVGPYLDTLIGFLKDFFFKLM